MLGLVASATGVPLSQSPHWHVALHVCEPPAPQLRVAFAAQTPWPEQADHADQTPFWQVCVCVPQFPQGCDAEAWAQTQLPLWQVNPLPQAVQLGPQCVESLLVSMQVDPHIVKPWLHTHDPQVQLAVQVCVPFTSHVCVVPFVHPLWPVQADQFDQVPFWQVRVWVPHAPQG